MTTLDFELEIGPGVAGSYPVVARAPASRQHARANGGVLRLVLRVRPPELARLPWEFLFDPGPQDYLGLTMPLVRDLQMLAPASRCGTARML